VDLVAEKTIDASTGLAAPIKVAKKLQFSTPVVALVDVLTNVPASMANAGCAAQLRPRRAGRIHLSALAPTRLAGRWQGRQS
jgi:hypothetical protein